jgi:hypothetical protein
MKKVRVVRYKRSSTVDIVEFHPTTNILRVRFLKNGKVWYSKEVTPELGMETAWRFSDARTGSFGKWAQSFRLFYGMSMETEE